MTLFRASLGFAFLLVCAVPLLLYSSPPEDAPQSIVVSGDLNLTFTTIDVPGAINTSILGINSFDQMVGYYIETTNGPATGFLFSGGKFNFFKYPGSDSTQAIGINDSGLISGTAFSHQNNPVGFLYDGTTFTVIRVPGNSATFVDGINNAGVVVGSYGSLDVNKAFELISSRFRTISPPGDYFSVFGNAVNNFGEVVGSETGAGPETGFAFRSGRFQTIAYPGALLTVAWGVNDSGVIVGIYEGGSPFGFHGFVFSHGKYASVDYPGATDSYAVGIDNAGQVVGSYTTDQQTYHGFLTSSVDQAEFR